MAPGKKSLAYSLVLRAADRTLTDEEAENAVKKVLANLAQIGVELRSSKWGSNRNGAAGKPSANASQALLCRQPQIPIAAFLPQMLASAALLGYNID